MLFPNEGTLTGSPQHSSCISTGMAKRQVWYREGLAFHARSFESGGPSGHPVQSCGGCIVCSVSFSLLPPKVVVPKALTNSVRALAPTHWGWQVRAPVGDLENLHLLCSLLFSLIRPKPSPTPTPTPSSENVTLGFHHFPKTIMFTLYKCWDFTKLSFLCSQKQKERKALPCPTWALLLPSRFSCVRLCATP